MVAVVMRENFERREENVITSYFAECIQNEKRRKNGREAEAVQPRQEPGAGSAGEEGAQMGKARQG